MRRPVPIIVSPELLKHCWFLAGPTASGKTAVSLELAARLDAEIVVMDSMTVYRGMDIGTAKATPAEQARVPHHLLDLVEPDQDFSVKDYLQAAEATCRDLLARQKTPLFVGGTGLYLRSLLRGVFEGPAADAGLRAKWEQVAEAEGAIALHRHLATRDSQTAARLHPNDQRRIIRALEVYELTGQPLSAQQQQVARPVTERSPFVFWLSPPRDWLHTRINTRVEHMIEQGLESEVRRLQRDAQGLGTTARQALGYKEFLDAWEAAAARGAPDDWQLAEVITQIQTRSRQFAKRQETWFRNLEECQAVPVMPEDSVGTISERILGQAANLANR